MPTMKLNFLLRVLTILVLLTAQALPVTAQNATGSIRGTVSDQNAAVIQHANVVVTNKATKATRKVNTGDDGIYSVENLIPGEYEVKAEAQGFSTQVQNLTVEVGATTNGNFSMTVGQVTQTVQVVGEAPIINTQDTVVGGVVNRQRIENLPLNGRSFLSVA